MEMVLDAPFRVALTTADDVAVIDPAVAAKLAALLPAATKTVAGTVRLEVLLLSATFAPLALAGCDKLTVHVDVTPEVRLTGVHNSEVKASVVSAREAVWVLPFNVAVSVAGWPLGTVPAVALNDAAVLPDTTDTVAGTVRMEELLDRLTVTPPAPAACEVITVHVELAPLVRLAGLHERELSPIGATRVMVNAPESPFRLAVTSAGWPLEMVPAVAVNVAVLALATIDTVVGTERN